MNPAPSSTQAPDAHSPSASRATAAICVAAALLMAFFAAVPLERFPHSGDEYAYQYQARTFLAGRAVNPPAPDPAAYEQVHIISTPERMYSKYPPGWPAVLAAGEAARVGFLVNPLLAALTLWVAFRLARRVAGDTVALAFLLLLATNGFYLLNGATFFSHPMVGLALVLGLDALYRYSAAPRSRYALAAGACLGAILLTRPQDALLVGAGFAVAGIALLRQAPHSSRLAHGLSALIGPALALGAFLLYNRATTGDALLFGHIARSASDRPTWNPLGSVLSTVNRLQEYVVVASVGLAAFLLRPRSSGSAAERPPARMLALAALIVFLYWLGYSTYTQPDGPPRFGPRYLYPAHILTFFLAATALVRSLRPGALRPLLLLVVAAQLVQTGVVIDSAHKTIHAATGPERAANVLAKAIAPNRAMVLVEGPAGSVPTYDLIRNGIDYTHPVVFVGRVPQAGAMDRIPYLWDGAGGLPMLRSLDPHADVQAVALTQTGATVLRPEPQQGWIVTRGSNRCSKYFWEFPGSRPTDWSTLGPCGEGIVQAGHPPAPGEAWEDTGRKWFFAVFRTFLDLDEPGSYAFHLRVAGAIRLRLDGRTLLETQAAIGDWAPEMRVDLDPGIHRVELSYFTTRRPALLEWSARGPSGEELESWRYSALRAMAGPR